MWGGFGMTHPIRDAEIHVFNRMDGGKGGAEIIARFYPYDTYPVFAHGRTAAEAIAKLEVIRTEAIEKYEKQVIAREAAKVKRAATVAAKKAAKEASK